MPKYSVKCSWRPADLFTSSYDLIIRKQITSFAQARHTRANVFEDVPVDRWAITPGRFHPLNVPGSANKKPKVHVESPI
jgi:hypothetical protein